MILFYCESMNLSGLAFSQYHTQKRLVLCRVHHEQVASHGTPKIKKLVPVSLKSLQQNKTYHYDNKTKHIIISYQFLVPCSLFLVPCLVLNPGAMQGKAIWQSGNLIWPVYPKVSSIDSPSAREEEGLVSAV